MKILVIGNGFDLDHNLPTGYYEFIKFCESIIVFKESRKKETENLTNIQIEYLKKLSENEALLDKFYSLLKCNLLYKYFSKETKSNKWIDMEAEILSILTELDQLDEFVLTSNEIPMNNAYIHLGFDKLKEIFPHHFEFVTKELPTIFRNNIFDWLNKISIALEMYVSNFVNETQIEFYSPDIVDFDADKIITFNYSNIYEKIYSSAKEYSYCNYIHGKAIKNTDNNNSHIVLGITDPLIEHNNRSINSKFEKFFQRITKNTSNEYKEWLNQANNVEIAFFGHSLFSSDGDIIQELINRSDKITIFYYDLKMYEEIVLHLVEIIGKEKLIDYVYSSVPKIKFKQQQNHLNIENSGFEISKDIIRIKSLYTETESSINSFLDKIKEKTESMDTNYFHSQKLLINLYYELICNNISIIDSKFLSFTALDLGLKCSFKDTIEYNIDNYKFSENILEEKKLDFETLIDIINCENKTLSSESHHNYYIEKYSNKNDIGIIDIIKNELLNLETEKQWKDFIDFLINFGQNVYISLKYLIQKELSKLSNTEKIKLTYLINQYEKNKY